MNKHSGDASKFSVVLGGPLYEFCVRAQIARPPLGLVHRRVIFFAMVAWLPLLILASIDATLTTGGGEVPFLFDIETHIRLLLALPILIGAELLVHDRLKAAVQQFVDRNIVVAADMPKFQAAIDAVVRIRNSFAVELTLLVFVCIAGPWVWQSEVALRTPTWYATAGGASLVLSHAGYWYAYISIPIFQFILLRWYLRLLIWFWFLWKVTKLNLHLIATHPDRAGGLGFIGISSLCFTPALFAQGAILAGLVANRVILEGQPLRTFTLDAVLLIAFFVLFILLPLTMFTPALFRAKRRGLREYGSFATQYVGEFEAKWIRDKSSNTEALLGSADIQSLADLGNSYGAIREMRTVPFGITTVLGLIYATAAPVLPLVLTIVPLDELANRLIKIVF